MFIGIGLEAVSIYIIYVCSRWTDFSQGGAFHVFVLNVLADVLQCVVAFLYGGKFALKP